MSRPARKGAKCGGYDPLGWEFKKGKETEHEVIVYCKANPDQLIIEAIAVVFKDMRVKLGIEMKP